MKLKFFIVLFLSLFLIGTTNNYAKTTTKKSNKVKTIKKSNRKKTKKTETKCDINIQTKIPFTVEELRKFIPDTILKVEAESPSSGRRQGKLNQITTCSVDYLLTRRCILTITLTDYGSYDNISSDDIREYSVIPKEFGKSSEEFIIPCGDGFKMWHEKSNSGTISFLYCYRYIIKFDIMNLDNTMSKFEDFVKFFDLDKLVKESKKKLEIEKKLK